MLAFFCREYTLNGFSGVCAASCPSHHAPAYSLLFGRAIPVRTTQDLLADVGASKPRDIPRRLPMPYSALGIPSTTDRLVVLFVLVIQVLSSGLGTVHAVQTHTVEVSQRVGLRLQDDSLPVNAAAAIALGRVVVVEGFEATHDLADAAVVENVVDGPCITLGEGELVAADGGVPALAHGRLGAQDMTHAAVERLVEGGAKASAGVVQRT
jgi:hypothetical protein